MNSEEREVISGIFQRLEQASSQPRDADAERFIADKIRAQPYAPYAMAQLIYVQEEAIKSLNQQLEEARRAQAQAPQQSSGGGFLSSIFGGGSQRQEPQPAPYGQQRPAGQPWGSPQGGYPQQGQGYPPQGYPQQGYPQQGGFAQQQPARGGGFLATALPMAAGAAGGMLLGSALSNAFAGGHSHLGSAAAAGLGGGGSDPFANANFGSDGNQDFGAPLGGGDFQDSAFDNANDFGGDSADLGSGGDDDWA